jgi:hypothetical protein
MPICGANRSTPHRIGLPAHHEQPYPQLVLKIRVDRRGNAEAVVECCPEQIQRPPELHRKNRKGCDIGYAPAISSCEGANSVDACTIAALDAITAFAVPKPQLLLAETVGFFGSGCPSGHPDEQIAQPTSDWQGLFRQSFQPSTRHKLNSCLIDVNAILGAKMKYL